MREGERTGDRRLPDPTLRRGDLNVPAFRVPSRQRVSVAHDIEPRILQFGREELDERRVRGVAGESQFTKHIVVQAPNGVGRRQARSRLQSMRGGGPQIIELIDIASGLELRVLD